MVPSCFVFGVLCFNARQPFSLCPVSHLLFVQRLLGCCTQPLARQPTIPTSQGLHLYRLSTTPQSRAAEGSSIYQQITVMPHCRVQCSQQPTHDTSRWIGTTAGYRAMVYHPARTFTQPYVMFGVDFNGIDHDAEIFSLVGSWPC